MTEWGRVVGGEGLARLLARLSAAARVQLPSGDPPIGRGGWRERAPGERGRERLPVVTVPVRPVSIWRRGQRGTDWSLPWEQSRTRRSTGLSTVGCRPARGWLRWQRCDCGGRTTTDAQDRRAGNGEGPTRRTRRRHRRAGDSTKRDADEGRGCGNPQIFTEDTPASGDDVKPRPRLPLTVPRVPPGASYCQCVKPRGMRSPVAAALQRPSAFRVS